VEFPVAYFSSTSPVPGTVKLHTTYLLSWSDHWHAHALYTTTVLSACKVHYFVAHSELD